MRLQLLGLLLSLSLAAPLAAEEPAASPEPAQDKGSGAKVEVTAPDPIGATLVLSPRADKAYRAEVAKLTRGLVRAAERVGEQSALLDADLAAATPGDLVSRCPARISSSCLAQAAERTGALRTLTGVVKRTGDGYVVQLRVIDGESGELFALRDVRLFPARGDELDMEIAGQCIGMDALWSAVGHEGALTQPPCDQRIFVTSWQDRDHYAAAVDADTDDLWMTAVPDVDARRAYTERNGMLAGAFASTLAVTVVGAAAAVLLGVQTALSDGEAKQLARDNPQAFTVAGDAVTVQNEMDPSVSRYREIEARGRLEGFAALGAGLAAVAAGAGAAALYQVADIPGRYDAYVAETFEEPEAEATAPKQKPADESEQASTTAEAKGQGA